MSIDIYRSATVKLTVYYMALVVLISLSFSVVVYHFAASELAHGLHTQSARIYETFPVFDHNPFFEHDTDLTVGEHHILWRLAEFNLVVLITAGFASYWLARRTLSPIEASNERQKRFTADVSHELRTPLTALKMSTEVALLDPAASKKELQAALKSNLEDAAKLERLTNNLLRLSRLDEQGMRLQFREVPLKEIVGSALDDLSQQAAAKALQLRYKPSTVQVVGDADTLRQLVVIVLENAIKYSPPKSKIDLHESRDGQFAKLVISDNGPGIKAKELRHIFDRFYRADQARSGNGQGGFGLGLSIAKQIADLHDGRIIIESTEGKGTTATIELPAALDSNNS